MVSLSITQTAFGIFIASNDLNRLRECLFHHQVYQQSKAPIIFFLNRRVMAACFIIILGLNTSKINNYTSKMFYIIINYLHLQYSQSA